MAIDNFIPEIWSAGVTKAFQAAQIVIPTVNRQYEGEATAGNAVNITGATTPTIFNYAEDGRVLAAEDIADTTVKLLIDNEKAFAFKVDDIDRTQAAGSFDTWTTAAGGALAEDAEAAVIVKLLAEAGTDATSGAITTGAQAKAALRKLRTELAKAKVPTTDRYAVVNNVFADLVLGELSDVATAGSDGELRNGVLGRLYGLTILESPMFADAVNATAVAYHSSAIAFVSQVEKTEGLRDQASFKDIVRGLHVYGVKVVKPEAVVKITND